MVYGILVKLPIRIRIQLDPYNYEGSGSDLFYEKFKIRKFKINLKKLLAKKSSFRLGKLMTIVN